MRFNHCTMVARSAVKKSLEDIAETDPIGVGCSGGADSLSLLAVLSTIYHGNRASLVHVVIVDHKLQEITASISEETRIVAEEYGFQAHIVPVDVIVTGSGMEHDARAVRYEAFEGIIEEFGLKKFLLGHTMNDQAEQVFLGLIRGSGTKSISGIPESREIYSRPLLKTVSRNDTEKICAENKLEFWSDPHNEIEDYRRVNVRKFLAEVEDRLSVDLISPLVKTATIAAEDNEALGFYASRALEEFVSSEWDLDVLLSHPKSIRARAFRQHLQSLGVPGDRVTFELTNRIEELILNRGSQGAINFSNNISVSRVKNQLFFDES